MLIFTTPYSHIWKSCRREIMFEAKGWEIPMSLLISRAFFARMLASIWWLSPSSIALVKSTRQMLSAAHTCQANLWNQSLVKMTIWYHELLRWLPIKLTYLLLMVNFSSLFSHLAKSVPSVSLSIIFILATNLYLINVH